MHSNYRIHDVFALDFGLHGLGTALDCEETLLDELWALFASHLFRLFRVCWAWLCSVDK